MSQAQIREINESLLLPVTPIEVLWNSLDVEIIPAARVNGKYKKVTLESKQTLIGLVKNGSSIISVRSFTIKAARSLKINYSTAKSIFQNIKAKATGKLKRKRFVETDSEPTSGHLKEENLHSL